MTPPAGHLRQKPATRPGSGDIRESRLLVKNHCRYSVARRHRFYRRKPQSDIIGHPAAVRLHQRRPAILRHIVQKILPVLRHRTTPENHARTPDSQASPPPPATASASRTARFPARRIRAPRAAAAFPAHRRSAREVRHNVRFQPAPGKRLFQAIQNAVDIALAPAFDHKTAAGLYGTPCPSITLS